MPATPEDCRLYRRRHRAQEREYRALYRKTYPERKLAYEAVRRAVERGELVRRPCHWCCSTRNIEAHHDDYDRPLDVIWLCKSCHRKYHRLLLEANSGRA